MFIPACLQRLWSSARVLAVSATMYGCFILDDISRILWVASIPSTSGIYVGVKIQFKKISRINKTSHNTTHAHAHVHTRTHALTRTHARTRARTRAHTHAKNLNKNYCSLSNSHRNQHTIRSMKITLKCCLLAFSIASSPLLAKITLS